MSLLNTGVTIEIVYANIFLKDYPIYVCFSEEVDLLTLFLGALQTFVWFVRNNVILHSEVINIVDMKHTMVIHHIKYKIFSVKIDSFVCQSTFLVYSTGVW